MSTGVCNCKTTIGRAHHRRLGAMHGVLIKRMKAETRISLKKRDHDDAGAFVEIARNGDAWHLAEVRDRGQFGQLLNSEREYVQRFELPECLLTLDEALTVAVIDNYDWRYVVRMAKEPINTEQFWAYIVLERERVTPCS